VKYENNNLGTMSKACQYATNNDNVFVRLILTNVKNAQTSLQKKYLDEKLKKVR
jgi:hypothetical protein